MANIKVAVRIRPISAREVNLTGSEVVVRTDVNGISLTNLKVSSSKAGDSRERTKRYGFDYCFDSSDPEAENFADQARIYQTLGQSVLEALFSGYNSCLVAYGQSASGKTYTMMGTKDDPGLTPRLCQGLFARLEEGQKNDKNYCVSVSYLEIYNERVRDLLKASSSTTGLRVREHPRLGPYVQGLTHHVVHSLGSLMSYVEEGTKARKTASTLQNPSSSRSHALLTIDLSEETPSVASGAVTSASSSVRRNEISPRGGSKLRLVDLAGSESAATCSGVHRLKEGANINKSLVALGNVISALAERGSTGSGPGRRFIPYRDSSLTWLLKDALGGNATTIMLATISPASGSYNETAHTLRFAQRAQSVVNRPMVNENPVARIIRDLRAEVARLKSLLLEKNIEPSIKSLCNCYKNQSVDLNSIEHQQLNKEAEDDDLEASETSKKEVEIKESRKEAKVGEGSRCLVPLRRSNSSDSVTTYEADSTVKKFSSFESLTTADRFAGNYKRARVTELNDEEDEVREIHESVFVDIPTLVAVLIKPDDNLQETSTQIEEICSDEVAEDSIEFIEAANDRETFDEPEKLDSIDHDEPSSSVNSCHVSGGNEVDAYQRADSSSSSTLAKPKQKPKFRKQDSVDILSPSISSNLHTSKKFGSEETILKRKKEPVYSLERSHTNLEKRQTLGGKKLNNIREIEDQQLCISSSWRDSKDQLQRKGSNESDKSLKEKTRSNARKPSLENLKRKTSKDSSSSSSKDEQILISSLARDKLLRRKSSLEQESTSIRSHTPIQRVKRAEIVAAVTERLYSSRKPAEDVPEVRSPPENANVKSLARMKLQEISRKMLGKRRRVCVDTQTESLQTVRLKDTASLTETPEIVRKDVGILTDDHVGCEQLTVRRTPVLRVKETSTLTDKPKTTIVRCKDVASLANDLEEFDYELHSSRNDSGILSDDTQNYAESNLSSTEVSDLCPEADRRAMYAESSTNTVVFSPCRSFAVQTPRSEPFNQPATEKKTLVCLRQCCNSIQSSENRSSVGNIEKNVISISLPDTLSIVIETTNASKVQATENGCLQGKLKSNRKECETQTEESNETAPSKDLARSSLSQTDGRVFRIENIFQDPNNVSNGSSKVDAVADRTEGTRNSITFRNSLGTSYVFEGKEGQPGGDRLHGEGFIRDGLITEAFITRKRSFNFKRAPSSIVYQDPWRSWSFADPLANAIRSIGCAKRPTTTPSSWQADQIPVGRTNLSLEENNGVFRQCQTEPEEINDEGISQIKPSSSNASNNDHDHGFSDDSLDYNEINASSESSIKLNQVTEKLESFCPPDVVAHTKKDCPKSMDPEKLEVEDDFEDSQVEFPKKNPLESIEPIPIHDYKSLILGRTCYNYEEVNEESDCSSSRVRNIRKKKVSFSSSNISENRADQSQSSKPILKSIIKQRRKKTVTEPIDTVHSSNDETDDSQQEEKTSLTSETDWKGDAQSTSSEEQFRDEQDVAGSSRDPKESCKKVKFSEEELHENTCSESDSFENADDDEEDVSYRSPTRNILEEYLSEAVTFMRNLNSINEYVNSTNTLERNIASPSHVAGGKRGSRRRSCFSGRNRDYGELRGRRVSLKEDTDDPTLNDDIVVSTESYERCLKGIQRLEECIRRVDKHNELLREKYGVDCESAGARLSLASPSTDPRVPTTNNEFTIPPNTDVLLDQPSVVTEQLANPRLRETKAENDLEKRIFDQLMNVANSVRCGSSSKLGLSKSADSTSHSSGSYSKFRERHNQAIRESICGDLSGSFSLEGTSDGNDQQDVTTYEITGNLLVGRTRSMDQIVDDHLDSTTEEDLFPFRRFDGSSWSSDAKNTEARLLGVPSRTIKRDDSSKYNFPFNYETTNGSRIIDGDDSSRKSYKNFPVQRVSFDNARKREFHESDDYSRRSRNSESKVCGCSRDQSDVESPTNEIVHLRDKLKYPGSPRARFLELLRERRRIVEYSRGTSAS